MSEDSSLAILQLNNGEEVVDKMVDSAKQVRKYVSEFENVELG